MFIIHMPTTFKLGDTANCRINGSSERVTWRDEVTLVIEPDDARTIAVRIPADDLVCFICGDKAGNGPAAYAVDACDDGVVVYPK